MHIALALVALSFSFEFVLFRNEIFEGNILANIPLIAIFFLQTLFIMAFSFVLHELGHKYVAQKKGLWAEFRAWPAGLLLAVVMAIVSKGGFVFAAPGAVVIGPKKQGTTEFSFKTLEKKDVGLIGIIGVIINIVLATIFGLLSIIFPAKIFMIGAQINGILAVFNLIPIAMFDGAKVWYGWTKKVSMGTDAQGHLRFIEIPYVWPLAFALSVFIFVLAVML
jgi:Zn-dependent protease